MGLWVYAGVSGQSEEVTTKLAKSKISGKRLMIIVSKIIVM